MDLKGRVALVTGASRGIGRDVALALAGHGASVAVNYLRSEAAARQTVEQIRSQGVPCLAVRADVSKSVEVDALVAAVTRSLGEIEILVNNAAISRPQPLADITERDWDEILETNLKSVFLVTQAVLPSMRRRKWGRVINLSSVAAQTGGVVGPHYAASKAGIIGLTHSYANLLAREGITVNAVAPALIATEMLLANPNARADLIPIGRFGEAGEVTDVVVMLATNGYITGQTINVNGGWYMS